MHGEITKKNIAPIYVLTSLEQCTFEGIKKEVLTFPNQTKKYPRETFICESEIFPCKADTKIQLSCVVEDRHKTIQINTHKVAVLPRIDVVSTVLTSDYGETDLEKVLDNLNTYMSEHQLTSCDNYRIVFHKEKRKWQRNRFFRRTKKDIITDVQIIIEE